MGTKRQKVKGKNQKAKVNGAEQSLPSLPLSPSPPLPPRRFTSSPHHLITSSAVYLLLTLLLTWPVAGNLGTRVAGIPGDDNFQFVWNLWWHVEALLNQGVSPANVTMLHWPDGGPNPLLGLSVLIPSLAMPTTLLFGPVVSYNLWFLLSFPLAGVGGWLLTAYVTGDRRAAFVGGLVFALFPHKTMQGTAHYLQIMLFLFPLYTIALLRLLRRPSWRQALVAGVTLSAALLVNLVHIGFFLLPLSVLVLLYHLAVARGAWWRGAGPRTLALMLLVALVLTGPILLPFVASRVGGGLGYLEQPGTVRFSTDFLALWLPAPDHPLLSQWPAFREASHFLTQGYPQENIAYLGYTALALAALGAWRQRRAAALWLLLFVVMVTLSLGPFLKVGGAVVGEGRGPLEVDGLRSPLLLPYAAMMQLPFYEWGRIPNRQIMVAMMALGVLAGLGVASLRPRTARAVVVGATVLLVGEYLVGWPFPTDSAALRGLPVWRELRQEGRGAVLDLPQWNFFAYPSSNDSLFAQTAHGQPIVGGYIHRLPPGSAETARAIQDIVVPPAPLDIVPRPTGDEALATLRALGIATVVLHRDTRGETYWWTGSTWSDADDAAAHATLSSWAGAPRWSDAQLAIFDLPGPSGGEPPPLWTVEGAWHAAESDGTIARRWLEGEGEIGLWLPAPSRASLHLDVQAFAGPRTLTLSMNDREILSQPISDPITLQTPVLDLPAGFTRFRLTLPEGCQRPTDLDPAAGDQRCLGVLVSRVGLIVNGE